MIKNTLVACILFFSLTTAVFSAPQNEGVAPIVEADTDFCETIKYALINSLRPTVDKAIEEIYKNSPKQPEWAAWDTKITKVKQLYGVGGAYEITLRINTYYGPHISYGIDEVTVEVGGGNPKLLSFKHIKDL